jgi:hypothetical protein
MFRWKPNSSSAADPALELLVGAEVGEPADLRAEHVKQWRHAAKRVPRTYKAWCAAGWRDRQDLYVSFLDALRREERAARRVERDASALGAQDPVS